MKKRMIIMLVCLGVLFGGIALYKIIVAIMVNHFITANQSSIVTVSAMKVGYSPWQTKITATGSLRAIKGVNVTTELAGMVTGIYFTPGSYVEEGSLLVQLNADNDIAVLQSLKAQAELAKITYERDKAQYAIKAVSKQTLDTDRENMRNLEAQVTAQAATVAKKSIRAPFTGRLGINNVNLGQYLNPGDKVVTLQTLDPIYIDFYVPQQMIASLRIGQLAHVQADAFKNQVFSGKITTIEPAVDVNTRNVEIEATIENPRYELTPGMFATVNVVIGKPISYLTLPQTAVSFNPYGDLVFIVKDSGKKQNGKPILQVEQAFVTTGETRGDQVSILKGISEGDTIVTSGQLKLKNGSRVAINNKVTLPNNPSSQLPIQE